MHFMTWESVVYIPIYTNILMNAKLLYSPRNLIQRWTGITVNFPCVALFIWNYTFYIISFNEKKTASFSIIRFLLWEELSYCIKLSIFFIRDETDDTIIIQVQWWIVFWRFTNAWFVFYLCKAMPDIHCIVSECIRNTMTQRSIVIVKQMNLEIEKLWIYSIY